MWRVFPEDPGLCPRIKERTTGTRAPLGTGGGTDSNAVNPACSLCSPYCTHHCMMALPSQFFPVAGDVPTFSQLLNTEERYLLSPNFCLVLSRKGHGPPWSRPLAAPWPAHCNHNHWPSQPGCLPLCSGHWVCDCVIGCPEHNCRGTSLKGTGCLGGTTKPQSFLLHDSSLCYLLNLFFPLINEKIEYDRD